eukprot:6494526-Heterocapsa_arctica.AAC.1
MMIGRAGHVVGALHALGRGPSAPRRKPGGPLAEGPCWRLARSRSKSTTTRRSSATTAAGSWR